jgi:hypothetical protein
MLDFGGQFCSLYGAHCCGAQSRYESSTIMGLRSRPDRKRMAIATMKALFAATTALFLLLGIRNALAQTQTETVTAVEAKFADAKPYTSEEEERDARAVRFGSREILLAGILSNARLQLENDGLDNKIARIEGKPQDQTLIPLDRYLVGQLGIAVEIARRFALVWSKIGTKEMQRNVSDAEKHFDAAVTECIPDHDPRERLTAAKDSCNNLNQIDLATSRYHFKGLTAPSVFKETAIGASTKAQGLLRADSLQLRTDAAGHQPKKVKDSLIQDDQRLVDLDKSLRLAELSQESVVKHNNAHPDSPQADILPLISELVDYRTRIADISAKFRQDAKDSQH